MSVLDDGVAAFLDDVPVGVLSTARDDGTPRQSVVYFTRDGDTIQISTESKRAKARDVARTGRASLCVVGPARPFPSVTVEGRASIRREHIGEPTARVVGRITGQPPPEPQSDDALAAADRVILEVKVERVYGASYLPAAGAP